MSFAARLVHPLAIVRTQFDDEADARDDHGQPVAQEPTRSLVNGLVQPRSARNAREVPQTHQAGAMVSDHVIFLELVDLIGADAIEHEPDDGRRYEVIGIRRYDFGRSPHLEVDARMVRGDARLVETGS
jgi:hypothetical protein